MVGDGERVAVSSVTELELAFEVGAPQGINRGALRQRGTMRTVTRPAHALDQAMAIENGVDRAFGWNPNIASEPPDQEFADFARAPMRLVALERDDEALDLLRQLVCVAHGPARTVGQCRHSVLLVAIENLVAGLAGYAEIAAHLGHWFSV